MSSLLQDLRYAIRSLRRDVGFTMAAVLTLALGIGANVALFSTVRAVLLQPLPFPRPEELVVVKGLHPTIGVEAASLPDFLDWRAGGRSFASLAAFARTTVILAGSAEPERIKGVEVTANFFRMAGIAPALGRGFAAGEERGEVRVAVLGDGLWRRRFGGDPRMIGRSVSLSGRPYTVIGIAPPGFALPGETDVWLPLRTDVVRGRRADFLGVLGRIRPDQTVETARAELTQVAAQLAQQYPTTNADWSVEVTPLRDQLVGGVRTGLLLVYGAACLVLLIACVNVANLLLARAASREQEYVVRAALGAGRGRLLRHALVESLVLAVAGAGAGVLVAEWVTAAIRATGGNLLPRSADVYVDLTAMTYAAGLALVTGLAFGAVPTIRLTRSDSGGRLRDGSRSVVGGGIARVRAGLIVGEVALAMVLLASAGLLLRSFARLAGVDPGFEAAGVVTYQLDLPSVRYATDAALAAAYRAVLEQSRRGPGVSHVALVSEIPTEGPNYLSFSIAGLPDPVAPGAVQDAQIISASPEYFHAMSIPVLEGRAIEPTDALESPPVAVVSAEMVRRWLGRRDPIGQRITFGNPTDTAAVWYTVVGVVGTVAQEGMAAEPYPQIYLPMEQNPSGGAFLVAKAATGTGAELLPELRAALRGVDSQIPFTDPGTLTERLARSIQRPRVSAAVLSAFAVLALGLAAVGIYGVVSYTVGRRTREIGVRIALGARSADIERLVVRQGMMPVAAGVVLGFAGAWAAGHTLAGLLYTVHPGDPLALTGGTLFLVLVAALASWLPARRAARLDPISALRTE
jgi:putative ABC transport system permease protein